MRTVIWFIYFFGSLLFLIPSSRKVARLKKEQRFDEADKLVTEKVQAWANKLLKLAGVEITVTGKENLPKDNTACVFVANHQGNYDIPTVLTSLPKPYGLLAKKEISKIPMISSWMKHMNCIFVDRSDAKSSMRSLNEGCNLVKNGNSLTIFPEGTRSKTGEIGEFKGGSFRIATKAKAPIVPIRIEGTRDIMENNGNFMKPGKVEFHILPMVETKNLTKEEIKVLPETVREIIVQDRLKSKK